MNKFILLKIVFISLLIMGFSQYYYIFEGVQLEVIIMFGFLFPLSLRIVRIKFLAPEIDIKTLSFSCLISMSVGRVRFPILGDIAKLFVLSRKISLRDGISIILLERTLDGIFLFIVLIFGLNFSIVSNQLSLINIVLFLIAFFIIVTISLITFPADLIQLIKIRVFEKNMYKKKIVLQLIVNFENIRKQFFLRLRGKISSLMLITSAIWICEYYVSLRIFSAVYNEYCNLEKYSFIQNKLLGTNPKSTLCTYSPTLDLMYAIISILSIFILIKFTKRKESV